MNNHDIVEPSCFIAALASAITTELGQKSIKTESIMPTRVSMPPLCRNLFDSQFVSLMK